VTVAAVTARVLSMRYEAAGAQEDLVAAIAAARRGLADVDEATTVRTSRTARLAHLLCQRYYSHGRRRDLDQAIGLLQARTAHDGHREMSPDQLSQLAGYLAERYDRDGNEADRDEAIRLGRQAQASDRRDGEPTLDANLAAALHDRFSAEGRLDDLDETVARQREALARQDPAAPGYPAMLSNLGIALQDCFRYRHDGPLLDESIRLHERAVADCPPRSPDHPGYLSTLASAVLHRFERDDQAADLDRAIDIYGQALADLSPAAPERVKLLGSLAAARHLRARSTADQADFDVAIDTFQAALRRIRRSSPMRPAALAGYAQVLADAPAKAGVAGRRRAAQVIQAFHEAVTASERAPLVRLDVACSFGEWALRSRLWREAAEAYHAAAEARRSLFGTQLDRAHRDTWLARSEEISASEAYAWAQSGRPDLAAAAMDAGRAFALAEALDARTVADRLVASGHHGLGRRYQEAIGVLAGVSTVRSE
jgi:tetratricopeptide (TPR) repeat protein